MWARYRRDTRRAREGARAVGRAELEWAELVFRGPCCSLSFLFFFFYPFFPFLYFFFCLNSNLMFEFEIGLHISQVMSTK
jgi:hypothetical protein